LDYFFNFSDIWLLAISYFLFTLRITSVVQRFTNLFGRFLSEENHYFNQRLARARGVIENTFGILSARWRVFHNAIEFDVDRIDKLIKAAVILHNFLMDDSEYSNVKNAQSRLDGLATDNTPENMSDGVQYREILKNYLNKNKR
jgi:DDE superfamily endonuclease